MEIMQGVCPYGATMQDQVGQIFEFWSQIPSLPAKIREDRTSDSPLWAKNRPVSNRNIGFHQSLNTVYAT